MEDSRVAGSTGRIHKAVDVDSDAADILCRIGFAVTAERGPESYSPA